MPSAVPCQTPYDTTPASCPEVADGAEGGIRWHARATQHASDYDTANTQLILFDCCRLLISPSDLSTAAVALALVAR